MDLYVIVATKGRSRELQPLLDALAQQTHSPSHTFLVGSEESDLSGCAQHTLVRTGAASLALAPKPGLCRQRNEGLERIQAWRAANEIDGPYVVVFFDDDFRPRHDWLRACRDAFLSNPELAGLTGQLLADGIKESVPEHQAQAYLRGDLAPAKHWASGPNQRDVGSAYGCNMAFRDSVASSQRFDENLPLYGWQEDLDFSARAKALGRVRYVPECVGVHMGVRSGRVSGIRFGYSQIANPWYLARKGTMQVRTGVRFASKNVAANSVKSLLGHDEVDYVGRLRGNLLALADVLRGRAHPLRVLELS